MQRRLTAVCLLLSASVAFLTALPAGAASPRGRPQLNAARTTFVGDNGQRLRGPYTSTEWTSASTQVAAIKGLGFNALHLYAESFDANYPASGSTAPGYASANVDSIVAQTRTNGVYLIITIGNGANNGKYNAAYITNFWKFYAARYANETHVLFEIQNEPVAWGPPYSAANATPPGALDMEVAAYKTIRAYAPNTPVLLFTYAVLGDSGGASAALTDIHAFNTNVFGNANAVWTNEAVGFHGYAGANSMSNAVSQIIAAGYPCFMTEFASSVWGTGVGGVDPYTVADLERLGVSWLTFQYIPPTGVSDDVTVPKHFQNIINFAGISWTPDYGNWPAVRGPYGNNTFPWSTPGYANNTLSGSLRIQAENFDTGGEGVAYHDTTATNLGGQYRTDEAVDIEITGDTGGGYDVTGTAAGEWLEYTLSVTEPGYYNLALRVAATSAGSVQALAGGINGTNLTGPWTVPATGGAQTWTTISNVVFLTPGQQVLHLDVLAGGFNLNWLQLSPVTAGTLVNGSYKILDAASALAATGASASNVVIAATYNGTTAQQWNFQHTGGGQYKITCNQNGWSLTSGGFFSWINKHYFLQAAGNGYYRLVPTDSGFCLETTRTNQSDIDEQVASGTANQQWAIVSPSAPAFPTALSAVAAGSTSATLTWNAVTGAGSYNIKRSTASGGPYATVATGITTTNFVDTTLSPGARYFYVASAVIGAAESVNSAEAALQFPKLTGAIIGTPGSWNNSGNTILKVFDGNLSTFFDAASGNGDWAGLDFGAGVSDVVTQIKYCPRSGYESRMVGGVFQGANQASFSDAVTLFTVSTQPTAGAFTLAAITNLTAFRYVRYLSPNNGFGNVAELEFDGYFSSNPIAPPAGLTALAVSTDEIDLNWNGLTNATAYNVKRSTTNGGPYTTVASGVGGTNYSDAGLAGGTIYYYVVSAMVSTNESLNSLQAAAATMSPTLGSLIHRYSFDESGGSNIADSVGGPVWTGTLPDGGALGGGRLTLSPASQQYASLPSGIVGSLTDFTVMAWVNLNSVSNWCRIFDFGNNTTSNLFVTPQNGGTGTLRFAVTTNGGGAEQQVNCASTLSTGVWHQVAITLSGARAVLYLDGIAVGTNSGITLNPSTLGSTTNNYLGKSQYPDPYLDGAFDEFRIYNAALSPEEIAATAALGAGQLLSTNSPPLNVASSGANLTFSWPLSNAGFTLQTRTNLMLGDWVTVTSPAPQILGGEWQILLPQPSATNQVYYRLVK
jgi:endoglucanase